jgi:endonuclease/exonuclease/phosphatase family metal-dependent hydrolase
MNIRVMLLPLLLALQLPSQSPASTPTLRIGTWNLEFLGAAGNFRNNLPPRDDADFARIGERVRSLGAQVLAVQEICGEAPLAKVAAAAGPAWRFVLGTTGGWDDGKTSQQVGFLYDSAAVEMLFAEERLDLPREAEGVPIFHRVPVTAAFRTKATGFDFRVATVHLKAGQKKPDEQKRRLEAMHLHGWLSALLTRQGEDQDVLLLGDFNSTYGAEPESILEAGGTLRYLEPKVPSPTIQHFPEPIDHIAVGPGLDEVRAETFTVHGDLGGLDVQAWRKVYSDHYPVTVDVVAAGDGDPQATFERGPAEHALPAARRTGAASLWPPKVGTTIEIRCTDGWNGSGTLSAELPGGPGGWVVLQSEGVTIAVPRERIAQVLVRP